MSHPLIRSESNYVVIEPGQEERFLTAEETLRWLEDWLIKLECLPDDLKDQQTPHSAAKRLLDTACDLTIENGFTIQWFAVRLENDSD